MSNQPNPWTHPSFVTPALKPAIFIIALLCFLVLPSAAEEIAVKAPPTVGWDDRPHPIHPRFILSETELDFGELGIFGLSEMTVTVTNTSPGTIPLKIDLSHKCEGFRIPEGQRIHHLRRNESVEIPVVFAPLETGDHACLLEFGNQVPSIPLMGVGGPLITDVELNMAALEFGEVILDNSNTLNLKITNTGVDPFTLDPRLDPESTEFAIHAGLEGYVLAPGTYAYLTMDYIPTLVGPAETLLYLGAGLPRLDVTGTGVEPFGACESVPDHLEFGPLSPGQSQAFPVKITNLGNINLNLSPTVSDPNFTVTMNSTVLRPGQSWDIVVTFAPLSWGTFSTQVDLGDDFCAPVECTGLTTPGHDPSEDNVGLYFDEGLTQNRTTTTTPFEVVNFYLAMLNPSNTSGIAGWECRIGIDGQASIVSFAPEGNALNVGTGNEFIVGIGGDPLPYSPAVLLASFQLVKLGYPDETVALSLLPRFNSSLPGMMVWLSSDNVSDLKPMFPVNGESVVAMINDPGKAMADRPGKGSAAAGTPAVTRILPNAPNPFNPRTEIRFELAKAGQARLNIYDVTGRLVKTLHDGHLEAARHTLTWKGRDNGGRPVASGVYYLRMITAEGVEHRKMMLVK